MRDEVKTVDPVESPACEEKEEKSLRCKSLQALLPRLPRDCARFTDQTIYAQPSDMLKDMIENLPQGRRLNEDQHIFMLRFGTVLNTVYREEQELAPENRSVFHLLLLGQGGSGKTHIVQNLIFPVVQFIWPPQQDEDALMVVAAKNAQAKNISTESVRAKTLHTASCMRVQSLSNSQMSAGKKLKPLQKMWNSVRVLIIEEISMVAAMLYNMLDFRAMLGRRVTFKVDPQTYSKVGCAFGRVPIVVHLGDFYQLRPTAQLSLLDDLDRKDEYGQPVYRDVPSEVQHAQKLFAAIPDVFELRGTMRFKAQDPLIDILQCMRTGQNSRIICGDSWKLVLSETKRPASQTRVWSRHSFVRASACPSTGHRSCACSVAELSLMPIAWGRLWSCCKRLILVLDWIAMVV